MANLELLALFISFTCMLSSEYPRYDRCNPEWVSLIQGERLDCSNPSIINTNLKGTSFFLQACNIASSFNVKIDGR